MVGNQMALAMQQAGVIDEVPTKRRRKDKQFKCHKCGNDMQKINDTNVMTCSNCRNYFIFDK